MRARYAYIVLIVVLIYSPLHSQKYLPPEVLSVEHGLSSLQISCLTIGDPGYLWVGTDFGLNRYDGYRFRHFFTAITGEVSSGTQVIRTIRSDLQGNLWILNNSGINRYDHQSGAITGFPISSFDTVFQHGAVLKDMYPGADSAVWILTDKTITMLIPGKPVRSFLIPAEQLKNNAVPTCILSDGNGNVWIGTTSGLLVFNQQQSTFRELMVQGSQGLLSDDHVNCLYLDADKNLWIGTSNGLNRLDPVDFSFSQYFPGGSQILQPANDITAMAGAEKNVMVLASKSGIIRFNLATMTFNSVYQSSEIPVHSVAVDSSGIIWGGTDVGILKIRRSKLSVNNYTTKSTDLRLTSNRITCLGRGPSDNLLIGNTGDNFDILDLKTHSSRNLKTLSGSNVLNFYPYKHQEFLVLSEHDIEVASADFRVRKSLFALHSFLSRELAEQTTIKCLLYDGKGIIWLGTSDGLQVINFDSAHHVARKTLNFNNQKINIGQVFDLEMDQSGSIWLATSEGLVFYNPVKGNYSRYTPYDRNLMNTERKEVYTLVPDASGTLWIGTSGGAFSFNTKNREFTALPNAMEITNSSVTSMAIDKMKNVWLGTDRGLYYFRTARNSLMHYDLKDGLLSNSYTAILAGNDDYVFLAGQQGLSIIDLTAILPGTSISNVAITGLRFIEKEPSEGDLFYQLADTIFLPWNRKPIQIDFAVLDLSRPEFNQFSYSFGKTGKNQEWYQLGHQNHIILDHLAPGKYRLHVTGCNSDKAWNNSGTSLVIIIEAPFWRSRISLLIYIVLGTFIMFMFIRFWILQFFNLSRENQEREMFGMQIMLQKEELALKNKSITDSINYAKRIQTAMLPPYKLFKSIFPSSFILFMPKDIVSGDFYWINKLNDKIFIAAVDCTGHGVPGAFMSIIGFELFRKITNIEGLSRPSDILNRLNEDFHVIFKDVENVVLRDGMDVAFCSFDKKDMILEFAGAFNPLYLIRDNKITEIKGDRFAIGLDETNFKDQTFKNHIIPIQKGDILYIFSDGFADQFGGPDGKKYKYRRFRHLLLTLHQLPMEKQHEILENNVIEWRGDQDQVDDILVIGIKIDF
jgi:ligand-binding sensor domain-containing protein/serine phosphatase RsbU (regulator of sigma subunit)